MSDKYTHIRVTEKQRDYIKKASQRLDKPMGEYSFMCVQMIHKRRWNPYDPDDLDLIEEFKKLRNGLLGYIRNQEKDFLMPILKNLGSMAGSINDFSDILSDLVAQNVQLIDDEPTESKEKPSEALISPQSDQQKEIERLKRIVIQKDEIISKQRKAISDVREASFVKNGKIRLNLDENTFNNILSI